MDPEIQEQQSDALEGAVSASFDTAMNGVSGTDDLPSGFGVLPEPAPGAPDPPAPEQDARPAYQEVSDSSVQDHMDRIEAEQKAQPEGEQKKEDGEPEEEQGLRPREEPEQEAASEEEEEDEAERTWDADDPLTDKQYQTIKDSPELLAVYNDMHDKYEATANDLDAQYRQLESERAEVREIEDQMKDPKAFGILMKNIMENRPDIAGYAFEQALTGEKRQQVLTALAMQDPTAFDRASEVVRDIRSSPQKTEQYKAQVQARAREQELAARERDLNERAYREEVSDIEQVAFRMANSMGISQDDWQYVEQDLRHQYRRRVRKDGTIDFSVNDIEASVLNTRRRLRQVYDEIESREREKRVARSQQTTRRKAQSSRRRSTPPRPQSSTSGRPKRREPLTTEQYDDFLKAAISRDVQQRFQ